MSSGVNKRKSTAKSKRMNFRASPSEVRLIRLGAQKRGEKVTRFIVESACSAAEIVLADQKHFDLPPAEFVRFSEALDRPAKVIPTLQRLFSEKSAIERNAHETAAVTDRTVGA